MIVGCPNTPAVAARPGLMAFAYLILTPFVLNPEGVSFP